MDIAIARQQDEGLSRAVSAVDLTATLAEVQNLADWGPRYSNDHLLSLRPSTQEGTNDDTEEGHIDTLKTPPYELAPIPPPPTPASPENGNLSTENIKQVPEIDHHATGKAADVKVQPAPGDPAAPVAKKAKSRSSGPKQPKQPKKAPPSGFEEFYADAPITPDEHEEETDLYDISRPFHERMQTCIQRYRARRKLDSVRSNVLTKYLALGGVETSGKMFTGGLDKETLQSSTSAEIAALQASDFLRIGNDAGSKYFDGSDNWVVDFEGVAKGFFSCRIPRMFSTDTEQDIKSYVAVIRNFLNYVLQHGVCKDFTQDVLAARKVCALAELELWNIRKLQLQLPGDYNMACSTVFGGRYEGVREGMLSWCDPDEVDDEGYITQTRGFGLMDAKRIVDTSIALTGSDELFENSMNPDFLPVQIISIKRRCFEVVGIERADASVVKQYCQVMNLKGEMGKIKPLGFLLVKNWDGPELEDEDFTDNESSAEETDCINKPAADASRKVITESFWFEDELLLYFFPGMKLEMVVHELSIGLKYVDHVSGVFCSFWTYLPNEKMVSWKEPAPNTRPPPTEDDPDVEDRAMDALMEDDMDHLEKDFTDK